MFTTVTQLVLYLLPGKDFPSFWICTGSDPTLSSDVPYKSVLGNTIFKIFSGVLHLAITTRIKLYKMKIDKLHKKYHPRSKMFWLFSSGNDSAVDIAENVTVAILLGLLVFLHNPRKGFALESMNQYPECFGEQFFTLIRPVLAGILVVCNKLISEKSFRMFLANEWKSFQGGWNTTM